MYSSEIKLCTQGKTIKEEQVIQRSYVKHRERLEVLKRKTGWSTNYMIR